MLKIATNILEKFSEKDISDIKDIGKPLGQIELYEYVQKSSGLESLVNFFLDGLNLKHLVVDGLAWDALKSLFIKLRSLADKEPGKKNDIQLWIRDMNNPAALNIGFSLKEDQDISDLLTLLKTKLDEDIFSQKKEERKGKLFSIVYDKETKSWLVKEF